MDNNLQPTKQDTNPSDLAVLLGMKILTKRQIIIQFINVGFALIIIIGFILIFAGLWMIPTVIIGGCFVFIGLALFLISGYIGFRTAKTCTQTTRYLHLNRIEVSKLCKVNTLINIYSFILIGWLQAILFMKIIKYEINLLNQQIKDGKEPTLILPSFDIAFPRIRK